MVGPRGTHETSNVKRESTLLYLHVVPMITEALKDCFDIIMHEEADTAEAVAS